MTIFLRIKPTITVELEHITNHRSILHGLLANVSLAAGIVSSDAFLLTCTVTTSTVASRDRIVIGCAWNFTGKLFESLSLGLWDQKCRQDTAEHEQSENLPVLC